MTPQTKRSAERKERERMTNRFQPGSRPTTLNIRRERKRKRKRERKRERGAPCFSLGLSVPPLSLSL